jgi:hypothetical protein
MNGTYFLTGSGMYQAEGQPFKLIITKRKHAKPGLASSFVLLVDSNGKRNYCSSLYPTQNPEQFNIEYKGTRYKLINSNDTIKIETT